MTREVQRTYPMAVAFSLAVTVVYGQFEQAGTVKKTKCQSPQVDSALGLLCAGKTSYPEHSSHRAVAKRISMIPCSLIKGMVE